MATMGMKERWAYCGQLAEKIGIEKADVFNILSILNERHLSLRIYNGDAEAIAEAKLIHEHRTRPYASREREYREPPAPPQTAMEAMANDMRLILWAVTKIGDKDRAKAAFDAVMKSLKDT